MPEKVIVNGVRFDLEKATKRTIRYQERENSTSPAAVGTVYIQKWALGDPAPKTVEVTIKAVED